MSVTKGDAQMRQKTLPNIILKKNNISFLKSKTLQSIKPMYKEDIIYQSQFGDFMRTEPGEKITITNRLNLTTMRNHTVAQLTQSGKVVWEKTSEYIASVIGQDKYEIVFASLCSVISQEFKIRAILALLSEPKKPAEKQSQSCQSDLSRIKIMVDNEVQTIESRIEIMKKPPLKRMKRQLTPYVVAKDNDVSKVIIHPKDFDGFAKGDTVAVKTEKTDNIDSETPFINNNQDTEQLEVLKFDEDSRDSIGNVSSFSINSFPELLTSPLSVVDRVTEPEQCYSSLTMLDGTVLNIPCKIEDDLHVATPEILRLVPPEYRRKLLWYQAYTDWKYCLTRDDDDNLPIHLAVLNDDLHLLRRQCLVLKTRNESVDITNGDNLTALQISIMASSPQCTTLLMQHGANPLVSDEEYRTCFHLAAEAGSLHLEPLIQKCKEDPLSILRNSEELWKPDVALKSKDHQVKYLLYKVCTMFDSQGYTPLMLASKLGKHDSVKTLLSAEPQTVDYRATSSGATALYIAVGAAWTESTQHSIKSKSFEDFKKTIVHLVEAGADPNIDNYSGNDVNSLLADTNNSVLSMIIASKRSGVNCKEIDFNESKPFILVKESDGTMMSLKAQVKKIKEINKIKGEIMKEAASKGKNIRKDKPIILENKVITEPSDKYINSYRNFVHELKKSKIKKNYKANNEVASTSQVTESNASNSNAVIMPQNIKKEIDKPNEVDLKSYVTQEVEINNEDPLAISTNNIKKEDSENLTNQDNLTASLVKAEKRRNITSPDVPPPLVYIVKSKKLTPTSPKRQKTKDN